jgi:mannonate dehydratase
MGMQRRQFFQSGAAAALAAAAPSAGQAATARPSKLKLGTQHGDSDEILRVMAAFGVNTICGKLPSAKFDENWSAEALLRKKEHIATFGIELEAVPLPLSSAYITKSENPNIMLGKSPERDREIDDLCQMIRNASKAGIRTLKYNMSILGVVRTAATPGRGGAAYSTFRYAEATDRDNLTEAGPVSADAAWERISYFVKRVMPVAEENKVRMACHPHDPGMPEAEGYRGVHRVLGSVAGLKKFIALSDSPYHGLNFCQGTVSEMLKKPGEEIYDVIRYFGSRNRIFNVHFRNIKGGFLGFQETFPDNGDVDFIRAARVYKEVGYDGMLMPDHVPAIQGDTNHYQAFAYCFGYIQAIIQLVNQEA